MYLIMSLRRIDHSSREVLPTVMMRRYVWSRNLVMLWPWATGWGREGVAVAPKTNKQSNVI